MRTYVALLAMALATSGVAFAQPNTGLPGPPDRLELDRPRWQCLLRQAREQQNDLIADIVLTKRYCNQRLKGAGDSGIVLKDIPSSRERPQLTGWQVRCLLARQQQIARSVDPVVFVFKERCVGLAR